jgi:phage head maturation protease
MLSDERRWELYRIYPKAFDEPPPKPPSRLLREWGGCTFSADETIARPTSHLRGLRYVPAHDGQPPRIEPVRSEEPGRTAFEESGHAVVDDEQGMRVTSICVRDDGSGQADAVPDSKDLPLADRARRKAISLWGGWAAQKRRYGNVVESESDMRNIRMCARLLDLEGAAAEEFIADTRKAAEAIVEKRWSDILKVAGILQVVRSMESRHFYKVLGKAEPGVPAMQVRTAQVPMMVRSGTVTSASNHEVELVWTTGASVRRQGFDGPYDEVLLSGEKNVRLDRLNNGAPLLNSHDSSDLSGILGSVVPGSAKMVNGQGVARVKLSSRAEVQGLVSDIVAGVIRGVSVGYRYHTVEVDRSGDLPVWRITDWEPMEVSAVAVNADAGASFRGDAKYQVEVRG